MEMKSECAGRGERSYTLSSIEKYILLIYFRYSAIIRSLTMSQSIAEDVIPPAYPAPSQLGYIPSILDWSVSLSRVILITAELRASMAMRSAFGSANPFIL